MTTFRQTALAALVVAAASQVQAADLTLDIQLPELAVAEYHKPYVAAWLENGNNEVVAQLTVWYDLDKRNDAGKKWLKDMRQWWRRGGRSLELPADGISGATQGPGDYQLTYSLDEGPLANLPAGDYRVRVEAAREVGGRELINLPFQWPASEKTIVSETGSSELGKLRLTIQP
jgi:hypothetical protein